MSSRPPRELFNIFSKTVDKKRGGPHLQFWHLEGREWRIRMGDPVSKTKPQIVHNACQLFLHKPCISKTKLTYKSMRSFSCKAAHGTWRLQGVALGSKTHCAPSFQASQYRILVRFSVWLLCVDGTSAHRISFRFINIFMYFTKLSTLCRISVFPVFAGECRVQGSSVMTHHSMRMLGAGAELPTQCSLLFLVFLAISTKAREVSVFWLSNHATPEESHFKTLKDKAGYSSKS